MMLASDMQSFNFEDPNGSQSIGSSNNISDSVLSQTIDLTVKKSQYDSLKSLQEEKSLVSSYSIFKFIMENNPKHFGAKNEFSDSLESLLNEIFLSIVKNLDSKSVLSKDNENIFLKMTKDFLANMTIIAVDLSKETQKNTIDQHFLRFIYSTRLYCSILSLAFFKLVESSNIIPADDLENFLKKKLGEEELFLPLSYQYVFSTNNNYGYLGPFIQNPQNTCEFLLAYQGYKNSEKIKKISDFILRFKGQKDIEILLDKYFPPLDELLSIQNPKIVFDELQKILKNEKKHRSLLKNFNKEFEVPDNISNFCEPFFSKSVSLLCQNNQDPLKNVFDFSRSVSTIPEQIDKFYEDNFSGLSAEFALTTEELFPIILRIIFYSLCKHQEEQKGVNWEGELEARVRNLVGSLSYTSLFISEDQRTGNVGYCLNSITAGLQYLESAGDRWVD